ncbi:MAG: protease inhibitor I42 family protein [Candidatus Peribacteraceae bacterium]|jgi:predicted secreted protein|nr:protease inhibitor I42 family protein [Candidatus Peribacteraceae bacterium]
MKNIALIIPFLLLISCAQAPQERVENNLKAESLAKEYIESADEFISQSGSNLKLIKSSPSACPGCWFVTYEFEAPLGKGIASISLENWEVIRDDFDFVDSRDINLFAFMSEYAQSLDIGSPTFNEVSVIWNTADAEERYLGKGFGYGSNMNSEDASEFHWSAKNFLKENGFVTDPHNSTSDSVEREIYQARRDSLICNIQKYKREEDTSTNIEVSCADTEASNISIKVGEVFTINLKGNPTTGFQWAVQHDTDYLELVEDKYMAYEKPHLVGVGGEYAFTLKSIKEGESVLVFTYQKPQESIPPNKLREYKVISSN